MCIFENLIITNNKYNNKFRNFIVHKYKEVTDFGSI